MRIDLSCPVEVWHCKMPTPQYPCVTMQIYNLSDKEVSSLQVCVVCFDAEGSPYARHVERIQGLSAPALHVFEATADLEEGVDARDLEVWIEKVWSKGGEYARQLITFVLELGVCISAAAVNIV